MPGLIVNREPLSVAIVGGGIIGLTLALGLIRRNIDVVVYEQARSLREIGAGVAFTANAVRCMQMIHPGVVEALRSVATCNGDVNNATDYLRWVDGYNDQGDGEEEPLFMLDAGYKGFEGCHRAHFLDALIKHIPDGVVKLNKRLEGIEDNGAASEVRLDFADGTSATADAVIGCDGIKSRVRQLLFGKANPASHAHYTHKVAYRALVPMQDAVEAIGEYKAKNQHMHVGPGAHVLHFPVAGQTLMNVAAFVADPNEWKADAMVAPGARRDIEAAFEGWGPTVRSIIGLLPEELERWAVFDSFDHPAPFFSQGRICIAGDAAHASSPHHGAGAGIGIEDALCLSTLLGIAAALKLKQPGDVRDLISLAFDTFNAVRGERGHWIVASSRHICDVYEWTDPDTKGDPDKCFDDIQWRSHKIWYFDYHGMLAQAIGGYAKRLRTEQVLACGSPARPGSLRRRSDESVDV